MRVEMNSILDLKILRQALVALGYSLHYFSNLELEAKCRPYHFKFKLKKHRTYIHGHIDCGFFHHPIYKSHELKKEFDRIKQKYNEFYSKI
jgi:hypothetical protein